MPTLFGVSFTDTLPAGLRVASSTTSICGGTLTLTAPRTIRLTNIGIPTNSACGISVAVIGSTAGSYTDTVTVTVGGWTFPGNSATAHLTVAALPAPTPAPTPTPAVPTTPPPVVTDIPTTPTDEPVSPMVDDPSEGPTFETPSANPSAPAAPGAPAGGESGGPMVLIAAGIGALVGGGLILVLFALRKRRPA